MSFIAGSMLITGALGTGAALYNSSKNRDAMKGGGVTTMPQYSFNEPRQQLTSDFISQNIERMSEGKYPAYYEKAMPDIRAGMQRNLQESYYGSPLNKGGVMGGIREAGAATGLGPNQVTAQTNKAMLEYSNKEKEIDEYLAKLGVGIMQQDVGTFTQASNQMPMGPNAQMSGGYATGNQPTDYSGLNQMAGALPYMNWGGQDGSSSQNVYDISGGNNGFGGSGYTNPMMDPYAASTYSATPSYNNYNMNTGYTGTGYTGI